MSSNFLASSGSCARISPPIKILSKYIHFLCTTIHTYNSDHSIAIRDILHYCIVHINVEVPLGVFAPNEIKMAAK